MKNLFRKLTFALCAPLLTHKSMAQAAPLIANINARETRDLDGKWQVIVDPYDVGSHDFRAQPRLVTRMVTRKSLRLPAHLSEHHEGRARGG